jgi:hypothetical protein
LVIQTLKRQFQKSTVKHPSNIKDGLRSPNPKAPQGIGKIHPGIPKQAKNLDPTIQKPYIAGPTIRSGLNGKTY